eukprot:scaffold208819_cov31-Tisochrysis_lutea.AAC.2
MPTLGSALIPSAAVRLLLLCIATRPCASGVTGLRISLYPKVPEGASLKEAIKLSTRGLRTLGLATTADSVSSCLLGPEPTLFEASRVVLGRAARLPSEPHVSMVCLFSSCDPLVGSAFELPPRTAGAELDPPSGGGGYDGIGEIALSPVGASTTPPSKRDLLLQFARKLRLFPLKAASALAQASGPARAQQIAKGLAQASDPARIAAKIVTKAGEAAAASDSCASEQTSRGRRADEVEWVAEASKLPARVACQFSIYVLGSPDYQTTREQVAQLVAGSPASCPGVMSPFCEVLDGDGDEVMGVLRKCFAAARASTPDGHVVMHATLTANLAKWKDVALRQSGDNS